MVTRMSGSLYLPRVFFPHSFLRPSLPSQNAPASDVENFVAVVNSLHLLLADALRHIQNIGQPNLHEQGLGVLVPPLLHSARVASQSVEELKLHSFSCLGAR